MGRGTSITPRGMDATFRLLDQDRELYLIQNYRSVRELTSAPRSDCDE
jgi:hypothetical protein